MRFKLIKALTVIFSAYYLYGCSDTDGVAVIGALPHQGSHTPHTDVEQGFWPPQPLGISDQQLLPASAREGARINVLQNAQRVVMNNPLVRQALGANFVQADGSLGDAKTDITASFLFYSYSGNYTVQVELARSGEVTQTIFPPHEYQPAEQPAEGDRAIELANAALTNAGFDTTGLHGTALLASPRASEITDSGQLFYPERVIYVTFGVGDGELPNFSALVNLSTGAVTEEGVIR